MNHCINILWNIKQTFGGGSVFLFKKKKEDIHVYYHNTVLSFDYESNIQYVISYVQTLLTVAEEQASRVGSPALSKPLKVAHSPTNSKQWVITAMTDVLYFSY